ncbi:MAG: VOC family protein [Planctomycetota bacterium]
MPVTEQLVEFGVYVDDLDESETFYRDVLGLELIAKLPGRHVFFKLGNTVLLLFLADSTLKGDHLPAHGARGPSHFAIGIPTDSREEWRRHLAAHGVAIEHEVTWPHGGKSLYFRDPAGNSVELITRTIWGLPDGW